tara:strand:+ start:203 stop:769 length:567 start_codon:yes stop_codon:yes gene_type:complete
MTAKGPTLGDYEAHERDRRRATLAEILDSLDVGHAERAALKKLTATAVQNIEDLRTVLDASPDNDEKRRISKKMKMNANKLLVATRATLSEMDADVSPAQFIEKLAKAINYLFGANSLIGAVEALASSGKSGGRHSTHDNGPRSYAKDLLQSRPQMERKDFIAAMKEQYPDGKPSPRSFYRWWEEYRQ